MMITSAITGYSVGVFIHVLAVVVALGPTFGYPIFLMYADRYAPAALPSIYRSILRIDRFILTPGLVVILLAGLYLITDAGISFSESWVSVGFLAVILLFGMAHGFFLPRYRQAVALTERDLDAGEGDRDGELSDEYRAISKQIERGGQIAALIIAVTIFFMVVKP